MENQHIRNTIENFKNKEVAPGNQFYWVLDDQRIDAPNSILELLANSETDEKRWLMYGWTGTPEDADIFMFSVSIDYIDESPIDAFYSTSEGDLISLHNFTNDSGGFASIKADDATLTIKLDPKSGIAIGDFKATFTKKGSILKPHVKFQLNRVVP